MAERQRSGNAGLGLLTVLLAVFVTLKLVHVIDWSWWAVLAPALVPAALGALAVLVAIITVTVKAIRQGGQR